MEHHASTRHLGMDVKNGVPNDFWTEKGLDRIDEIFIVQKFKGIAAAGRADIGTETNLGSLLDSGELFGQAG